MKYTIERNTTYVASTNAIRHFAGRFTRCIVFLAYFSFSDDTRNRSRYRRGKTEGTKRGEKS